MSDVILEIMSTHGLVNKPIDVHAIEERTQAIGKEVFAIAQREHAHLSVLNRWTTQLLSWCLTDPQVKSAVLRFIDVLPSLATPSQIARHVRDYFPTQQLRLPPILRVGSGLARSGLLTQGAVSIVVRQLVEQMAHQFIAQSRPEGASHIIQELAARGATCSFDVLGEQVLSEPEADHYAAQCRTLLRDSSVAYQGATVASCGPRANLL